MRLTLWIGMLALTAAAGCKTVEVAVDYPLPLASVHVVAKIEARDAPKAPATADKSPPKSTL